MTAKLKGIALVERLNQKILPGTIVVHRPSNNTYVFTGAGLHTETGEVMIHYMNRKGECFTRPFDSFFGRYFNRHKGIEARFHVTENLDRKYLEMKREEYKHLANYAWKNREE